MMRMGSLFYSAVSLGVLLAACTEAADEPLSPVARSGNYDDLTGAPDLGPYARSSELHVVATSGAYEDLSGTPDLGVFATLEGLSPLAHSGQYADLQGAPDLSVFAPAENLAPVAFSGSYLDLAGLPDLSVYAPAELLAPSAFSGSYADLDGTPDLSVYATGASLSAVAHSGSYADLSGRPDLSVYAAASSLAEVALSGSYADLTESPDLSVYATADSLADVALSGSYADLTGTPDLSVYAAADSLAEVALSGSYADLAGTPDLSVYAAANDLAAVATSGDYDELSGRPWVGDPSQIRTDAGVGIGGESRNPLTVHTSDLGFTEIDQSSYEVSTLYPETETKWQSFTPAISGVLVGVEVDLWWDSPNTGYSLNIYEGEGTNGTRIYTETGFSLQSGVGTVLLSSPVRLEESVQYTWELVNSTPFRIRGYLWASYAKGRGDPDPGFDYRFATYMRRDLGTTRPSLAVTQTGKVGVGTAAPTAALDIAGDLRVRSSSSPASSDPCEPGQISWDSGYVYVCVQTDTWRRAALDAY